MGICLGVYVDYDSLLYRRSLLCKSAVEYSKVGNKKFYQDQYFQEEQLNHTVNSGNKSIISGPLFSKGDQSFQNINPGTKIFSEKIGPGTKIF